MPTYATIVHQQPHDAVMMRNVAMATTSQPQQPPAVHHHEQNVISQLNIRHRGGVDGEVSLAQALELRQHSAMPQQQYCDSKDNKANDLAKFFSDNENFTLIQDNNELLMELDPELVQEILSSVESLDETLQPISMSSIGTTSYESHMQGDSVCEDREQEPPSMMLPVVAPAQSSVAAGDGMNTSSLTLYSPSPHPSNILSQPEAMPGGPLSPTGVAGTLLQQLAIDDGSGVAMDMAVSGSVGPTAQLICYVPTTQVCQFLSVFDA